MPELPEVEVTRRSLADRIEGAVIEHIELGKPLRWPFGADALAWRGRRIERLRRRGKYLLMDLDRGVLLLHLGMSGSLRFARDLPPPGLHDHFDMRTTLGTLRLHDPRRFGAAMAFEDERDPRLQRLLSRLGPEPLEPAFDIATLARGLAGRRSAIKQVLLGGQVVVGVGNIYASEALFRAGIHPATSADALSMEQVERLWYAIREVLQWAIEAGGSSLRDFADSHGTNGHFQLQAMVYGRAGAPCRVCAAPVQVLRQGGRTTFFCDVCQKRN